MHYPTIHLLKAWPSPFDAVKSGEKTFEFRQNDRSFHVGDTLRLQRWNPETRDYYRNDPQWTTKTTDVDCRVDYLIEGPAFGIPDGYCIMSISLVRGDYPAICRHKEAFRRVIQCALGDLFLSDSEYKELILWMSAGIGREVYCQDWFKLWEQDDKPDRRT
jgi:hypothetical protein